MTARRRIAGFAGRLVLIYALLVALLPVLAPAYAACFRTGGNLLFRSVLRGGYVRIQPLPEPDTRVDTRIYATNLRTGQTAALQTDSRKPGYLPTAFLVALVLATPQPWRRRLRALAAGLLLVTAFVAGGLLIVVLCAFCAPPCSLLAPQPPWDRVLVTARNIAIGDVVTWFMVPGLVWMLVSFRQADWSARSRTEPTPSPQNTEHHVHRDPHNSRRKRRSRKQGQRETSSARR